MSVRDNLSINLIPLLLLLYNLYFLTDSLTPLLVISFDGFRFDYVDKYPTPNLRRIAEVGVRAKWMTSVFATKTFPNHFTLITGLYEESHGISGNQMFDPVWNETFEMSTSDPKWWYNGLSVPIWVANQNAGQDRHSGAIMWASTNVPYKEQHIKYVEPFNNSVPWKKRIDKAVSWLTRPKDPANLVLVYVEEPDASGHSYGPDSQEVRDKVVEVDSLIGYLVQQLEEKNFLEKLNLIVLSDHGMAAVPEHRVIPMDKILDRALYKQYGHTPVWNILPNPGQEETVHTLLAEGSKIFSYTLYKKESIPEEYHYRNNQRILPFVIVADEGWDIAFDEYSLKIKTDSPTGGDHGYNNSLQSMHAIFLARGPSFKTGFLAEPFVNVDVYPLMCHLLDLPPPENINGSLREVIQLLAKENSFQIRSSWIVAGITLLCLCLAGALTGVVISAACKKPPPTISFVPLKDHLLYRDGTNCSEEHSKLLHATDAAE